MESEVQTTTSSEETRQVPDAGAVPVPSQAEDTVATFDPGKWTNEVVEIWVAKGIIPFINSHAEPMVHIPTDKVIQDHPVKSERVKDLVQYTLSHLKQEVPRKLLPALFAQIRECCRTQGPRSGAVEPDCFEKDPYAQGILSVMNSTETFDDKVCVLHDKIKVAQTQFKVDLFLGITLSVAAFGKILRRITPRMKHAGVLIECYRNEQERRCKLTRLSHFEVYDEISKKGTGGTDGTDGNHTPNPPGPSVPIGGSLPQGRVNDGTDGTGGKRIVEPEPTPPSVNEDAPLGLLGPAEIVTDLDQEDLANV